MKKSSIDVNCPHCHQAKQIIINILLVSYSISVCVPKIPTSCLNSLSFLISQNHLNNILISVFASLFKLILDTISYVLAYRVEVGKHSLLFGNKLLFENILDDFSSLRGLEFFSMFGFDLIFIDG